MSSVNNLKHHTLNLEVNQDIFAIPVIEISGTPSPDTLFIFAALHGDEYEATDAILRLQKFLEKEKITGKVFAFPVSNPAALRQNTRCTPEYLDGKNLARSFPGSPTGSYTQQLAHIIWQFILQNKTQNSYLIDLHSGGQHYSYATMSGYRDLNPDSQETLISKDLARAMLIPQLWIMPATEGTLSTVAVAAGIAAIGCEVEGTGGLNHLDSEIYLEGLINVLKYTNQINNDGLKLQDGDFYSIETILSPADGFIKNFPELHSKIQAGESICEILDYFGNPVIKVPAPNNGKFWAIRRNPSITKGEILAILSLEEALNE